jgi:hypothetical protein
MLDECEIASGTGQDCQPNGILDICELDPLQLYAIERFGDDYSRCGQLSILDIEIASAMTTCRAAIPPEITSAYGLAWAPDGHLFAALRTELFDWALGIIALDTGLTTLAGELDPNYAISDIAFGNSGVLYAVSGNEAATPGEILMINPDDATIISTGIVGGTGGGQSIAIAPDTQLLYHVYRQGNPMEWSTRIAGANRSLNWINRDCVIYVNSKLHRSRIRPCESTLNRRGV